MSITLKINENVAILTLDNDSKPNVINKGWIAEFSHQIGEIWKNLDQIRGVVITGTSSSGFCAGVDLDEVAKLLKLEKASLYKEVESLSLNGQTIFSEHLNQLPVPVVAAINGPCVGGGMELALWCHMRVAKAGIGKVIGLPEVNLGIIPGFGGCVRLPRLVGVKKALIPICAGKLYDPYAAKRVGLIDCVSPASDIDLINIAKSLILDGEAAYQMKKEPKKAGLVERNLVRFIGKRFIKKQTKGRYPAPLKALEVMCHPDLSFDIQALKRERDALLWLITEHPASRNLISLYRVQQQAKKFSKDATIPEKIAVVGAGFMGSAIAQIFTYKGSQVLVYDINLDELDRAKQRISKLNKNLIDKGLVTPQELSEIESRVAFRKIENENPYDGIQNCDLVIEAVTEKMQIKRQVINQISKIMGDHTILVTNTSSLSVEDLSECCDSSRFAGMHYFSPVHKMPLVEIIKTIETSDSTIQKVRMFSHAIGKIPIICPDTAGFYVNRVLGAYLQEALRCVQEGYSFAYIDKQMRKFGMPVGPFELMDEVGLSVVLEVNQSLSMRLPERFEHSSLLGDMSVADLKGKAHGVGFYRYKGRKKISRKAIGIIKQWRKQYAKKSKRKNIIDRLIGAMNQEAIQLASSDEASPEDIYISLVMGAGYPVFRQMIPNKELFQNRLTPSTKSDNIALNVQTVVTQ